MQAKYFHKTFISVKIAPHMGCNRRQDRNVIIIWINETREKSSISFNNNSCAAILYFDGINIGRWKGPGNEWDECVKWNTSFTDKHFPPKFPNFPESFGKWKTPPILPYVVLFRPMLPIFPMLPQVLIVSSILKGSVDCQRIA